MQREYCPFCDENITGAQKIYETDSEFVLYNLSPANRGQCLVVPKRHVDNVRELTDDEAASLFKTVRYVAQKLYNYLQPEGFNYGCNESAFSGQTVFHFHFHILPRFFDDSMQKYHLFHRDPETKIKLSKEEMQEAVTEFEKVLK